MPLPISPKLFKESPLLQTKNHCPPPSLQMCNSSKLLFSSITRLLISNLCQSTKFQQPIDKLFCIKQFPTPSCHVSEYKSFNQNVIVSHFNMCCNLAYISPPSTAPSKLLCYILPNFPPTVLLFLEIHYYN